MDDVLKARGSNLNESIDRLSLEQALQDAEVALARSHDLALRLVELRQQLEHERIHRDRLEAELAESRRLYEAIQSNRAYQAASKLWALRRALGV